VCHQTVSGAPGTVQAQLFTFGFLESRSAIIHRTVRWVTGLSVVPAEQWLRSATVDSNGHLQREQCADSSRKVRAAPKGAPDSEQCMSGAPRCQSTNSQNRQNPNSWVTWLAHQIVFGGTPDCPMRPSTHILPTVWFGGWGYKYPPTTTTLSIQVFQTSHSIQELVH
jgi:hypothetical protein